MDLLGIKYPLKVVLKLLFFSSVCSKGIISFFVFTVFVVFLFSHTHKDRCHDHHRS